MERVLVIGAGFMGAGIAQVCAQAGYDVHLNDVSREHLDNAVKSITWSVNKLASKGWLNDPEAVLNRVKTVETIDVASEADWIIEAVLEVESLKHDLFRELDRIAKPGAVLATNTSSIPISRIAKVTGKPERVVGLHFFGPVPFMGLVEVVKGESTSEAVFEKAANFVTSLGKTPVRVQKDIPMFVMNRIFSAAFNEAVNLVAEGVCTPEDVDVGMRLGYGWNVGPFEIADNAGLDTWALIMKTVKTLDDPRLSSGAGPGADLVLKMVEEGRLGKKSGRGFYSYTEDGKKKPSQG